MGESTDSNIDSTAVKEIEPNPLPISYAVVYKAIQSVFPDHAPLILHSLNRIVVIKKADASFDTMGVTANGTLYIAQVFWDKYMKEERHLQTVLMHEMMHCIGGDMFHLVTKDDSDDWQMRNMANNIAMDSRINAYICNSRPDIYPEYFFASFYTKEINQSEILTKLLTPSGEFEYDGADEEALKKFHSKFYDTEEFCSHHDLYTLVLEILKKRPKSKTLKITLLGAHGAEGQELTDKDLEGIDHIEIDTSELDKLKAGDAGKFREEYESAVDTSAGQKSDSLPDRIKEAIRDQLGQQSSSGAGVGSKSAGHLIELSGEVTEKFDLNKFKKMMIDNVFHNVRTQAKVKTGSYGSSPILPKKLSTTDLIMAAGGYPPLMWKVQKCSYKFDSNLLPIYLDVSGSTYSFLPRIVKLITNVSKELEFVWGFSNNIEKHTTKELSEGIIKGTGGTDFDCIIEHATQHKYEHIVVISDGDARCKYDRTGSKDIKNYIPGIKSVVTVLFGYAREDNYFSRTYGNTHMIEEVIV